MVVAAIEARPWADLCSPDLRNGCQAARQLAHRCRLPEVLLGEREELHVRFETSLESVGDQIIFGANPLLPIESLEASHREMTTGDILEMLDESLVHSGTTDGADDGKSLRGNLLRDHQSEACSDLGHELQEDRRSFLDDAAFGDEPGGFRNSLGEHTSNGEVSALRCVRRSGSSAQCEDLDAGEGSLRIGQVLALVPCDVRDQTQHDDGRNRQFDRKPGQAKRAARSARGRSLSIGSQI